MTSRSHQGIWSPPVKKFPMDSKKLPILASIDYVEHSLSAVVYKAVTHSTQTQFFYYMFGVYGNLNTSYFYFYFYYNNKLPFFF